jgi:hypothetical protein
VEQAIIERRRRRAIDELRNHHIICGRTPELSLLEELFAQNQAVAR